MIKFADPSAQYRSYKKRIDAAINRVLESEKYILGEEVENWNYEKLDETNRVANIIKQKINS